MATEHPLKWDFDQIRAKLPELSGLRILEQIGKGGMGSVYRAVDSTGRSLAVKVLSGFALDSSAKRRFEREALLLARLRHPAILTIHGYHASESATYMICELVEGEHFDSAAEKLELAGKLDLLEQLFEAVAAAHEAGICHRDLKPQNVLVSAGRVKVIDFGISAAADSSRLTTAGGFAGTPLYAAPERIGGKASRERGDVWSLGAMAYETLTGQFPYPMSSLFDVAQRLRPPTATPAELVPTLADGISSVVLRAIDPELDQRQRDAGELLAELRAARAAKGSSGVLPRIALGAVGLFATIALIASLSAARQTSAGPSVRVSSAPPPVSEQKPTGSAEPLPGTDAGAEDAERQADALRQKRGQRALRAGDLATAIRELGEVDPMVQLDLARLRLEGAAFKTAEELERFERLATAALASGPVPTELARRFQLALVESCLRPGASPDATAGTEASAAALVAAATKLGPSCGEDLQLVAIWLELSRLTRSGEYELAGAYLGGVSALRDPRARPAFESVSCRELWPSLVISAKVSVEGPELVGDQALASLPRLEAAGGREPQAFLRRTVLTVLATHFYRAACVAFRAGQTAEGKGLGEQSAALARRLQPLETDRERALASVIELTGGHVKRARSIASRIISRSLRLLLSAECDMARGLYDRSERRLDKIRGAPLRRLVRAARIHCNVLIGALTREQGLERLQGLPGSEARPPVWIEWREPPGDSDALGGGWWPGAKANPGR